MIDEQYLFELLPGLIKLVGQPGLRFVLPLYNNAQAREMVRITKRLSLPPEKAADFINDHLRHVGVPLTGSVAGMARDYDKNNEPVFIITIALAQRLWLSSAVMNVTAANPVGEQEMTLHCPGQDCAFQVSVPESQVPARIEAGCPQCEEERLAYELCGADGQSLSNVQTKSSQHRPPFVNTPPEQRYSTTYVDPAWVSNPSPPTQAPNWMIMPPAPSSTAAAPDWPASVTLTLGDGRQFEGDVATGVWEQIHRAEVFDHGYQIKAADGTRLVWDAAAQTFNDWSGRPLLTYAQLKTFVEAIRTRDVALAVQLSQQQRAIAKATFDQLEEAAKKAKQDYEQGVAAAQADYQQRAAEEIARSGPPMTVDDLEWIHDMHERSNADVDAHSYTEDLD